MRRTILLVLFLLASCGGGADEVSQHPPTSTPRPTATPVPLAELDLASLMYVEGDFPDDYEPQEPKAPIKLSLQPTPVIAPLAELLQDRLFHGAKNGRPHSFLGGSTLLQIYRTPAEARQVYEADLAEPSWQFPNPYEVGDVGTVELKQLMKGDPSSNAFRIEFVRCQALAYVTVFNTGAVAVLGPLKSPSFVLSMQKGHRDQGDNPLGSGGPTYRSRNRT